MSGCGGSARCVKLLGKCALRQAVGGSAHCVRLWGEVHATDGTAFPGTTTIRLSLGAPPPVLLRCREHIRDAAAAALRGLLPPSLPPAARAAATDVAAHVALVNCAQRLVAQVGSTVRGFIRRLHVSTGPCCMVCAWY